jgi:phosphatidylserine/phosphatidylglycerophosphate/cardiolipin synthase-like enzyme
MAASPERGNVARHCFVAIVAAATLIALPRTTAGAATLPATGNVEVAFTPGDAIDAKIVAAIGAAQREVLVLAYLFTHPKIARALSRAHARGLHVEIVADSAETLQATQSALPTLAKDGVPVWLDANFGAAHNKVMIIDADGSHPTTITGSYNYTLAAQRKNAENVIILRDNAGVAQAYRAYFKRLQTKATRWKGGPRVGAPSVPQ